MARSKRSPSTSLPLSFSPPHTPFSPPRRSARLHGPPLTSQISPMGRDGHPRKRKSPHTPFSPPPPKRRSARVHPNDGHPLSSQISPTARDEDPRKPKREEIIIISSTTTTPVPKSADASGDLPSPGTPCSPYSMTKPVVLHDWWLILLEQSDGGKRIGVQGFCTRGKKAARIFTSTPIIKRHDIYTLEIDGITVIIDGVIDKARSCANGFPREVCDRFLIGFPFNWEDYADGYFGKGSGSASVLASASDVDELSKGSVDSAGYVPLVHLDEFSLSRIHDGLTSMGCPIDNLSETNFIDSMKWLCNHLSVTRTTQMSSGAQRKDCLPEGTLSKRVRNEISLHENNTGSHATSVDHAGGLEAGHSEEIGCHRNDLNKDEVLGESSFHIPANFKHNVSPDSSSQNSKTDGLSEREFHMQKVTPLEEGSHIVRSVPADATDEILPKDYGEFSCNRWQRKSPASIISKSGCLDRKEKRIEIVVGIPATQAPTSARRIKKVKNEGEGVQAIKSSMEVEKNGLISVPADCNFINAVDDIKHKHRCNRHTHDLTNVGAVKNTLKLSLRELDRVTVPTGGTPNQADGHANDEISKTGGSESEGSKCFVECLVEVASQSDVMMEVHPSKYTKQNMSRTKSRKKHNTQHVYESPLTRGKAKKLSFASPELLNLKRSRSGRLLVPRLDDWCQQLVYTMDGEIIGITGVETLSYPYLGNQSKHRPRRKRRRLCYADEPDPTRV